MADLDDRDDQFVIDDLVQNSIIALANAVSLLAR